MTTPLYRATLVSSRWRTLKWRRIMQSGLACESCGRKYHGLRVAGAMRVFQLHHRHYRSIGHEAFEDVMVLCRTCHALEHGKIPEACDGVG